MPKDEDKPGEKSPEVEKTLEQVFQATFGRSRRGSIDSKKCSRCGEDATTFKDTISEREYKISGLCQKCQDWAFAPAPDDEEE